MQEIEILPVKRMDEVLLLALTDPPAGIREAVEEQLAKDSAKESDTSKGKTKAKPDSGNEPTDSATA